MTINRNDAPEGHEARAATHGCRGCAFGMEFTEACNQRNCLSLVRRDNTSVIFIKRRPHLVATGGRRPTPPEWAKKWRVHYRNGPPCHPISGRTVPQDDSWVQSGHKDDILFVEWLP